MYRLATRWLPTARILHPWPDSALRRQHPRQEPSALDAHAGICAGGRRQRRSLPRFDGSDAAPSTRGDACREVRLASAAGRAGRELPSAAGCACLTRSDHGEMVAGEGCPCGRNPHLLRGARSPLWPGSRCDGRILAWPRRRLRPRPRADACSRWRVDTLITGARTSARRRRGRRRPRSAVRRCWACRTMGSWSARTESYSSTPWACSGRSPAMAMQAARATAARRPERDSGTSRLSPAVRTAPS